MPAGLYRFSWLDDTDARNQELETNAAESEELFEGNRRIDRREIVHCVGGAGAGTDVVPVR